MWTTAKLDPRPNPWRDPDIQEPEDRRAPSPLDQRPVILHVGLSLPRTSWDGILRKCVLYAAKPAIGP